ncbi:MAG: 13E12 repeat family protein [Actinomycetota bacterium]|nr:13E12 repeat family protein [Actinomycetota bacterium]
MLAPRRSLTGETLPPALPGTAAELAADAIGPTHVRMITTTMRRLPPSTHPGTAAEAEQTLATAAHRFDPAALSRIGERLLVHLDPDGSAPSDEPETMRDLRVRTGPDGVVSLTGNWTPKAAPGTGSPQLSQRPLDSVASHGPLSPKANGATTCPTWRTGPHARELPNQQVGDGAGDDELLDLLGP